MVCGHLVRPNRRATPRTKPRSTGEIAAGWAERRRTGASRTARMPVVHANNLATKEHPFGDGIIAHSRAMHTR
jgi:hypothetical protein